MSIDCSVTRIRFFSYRAGACRPAKLIQRDDDEPLRD
jgi:hypothetical protein